MSDMTISASEFKAKCLALMDRVAKTGRAVAITKRGKVVARLVPGKVVAQPSLKGSIRRQTDLVSPIDAPWESAK